MKTTLASLPFFFACAALWAAPAGYDEPKETVFSAKKGAWEQKANWSGKDVPSGNAFAMLRGSCAVSVSQKVPNIAAMHIGSTGQAPVLTIANGGSLEVKDVRVWRNVKEADAVLTIDGGEFKAGLVSVGGCRTLSSTGTLNVNSGKLLARIFVGSDLPKTGAGTLSINGSDASAGPLEKRGQLNVATSGTLCFNLDEKGVGTINFENAPVLLASGSRVVVNGKNYRGGKKTISLIVCGSLRDEGASMVTEDFPVGMSATIQKKAGTLLLRIDKTEK